MTKIKCLHIFTWYDICAKRNDLFNVSDGFFAFIKDVFSGEIIPNQTNESFTDKRHSEKPEQSISPEGKLEDVSDITIVNVDVSRIIENEAK